FPQCRDRALTQGVGHGKGCAIAAENKRHIDTSVHVDDCRDTGHADGVDLLVGAGFDRPGRVDHIGDDDPPVTRNLGVPVGLDGLGKGLQHRKIVVEIKRRHEYVGLKQREAITGFPMSMSGRNRNHHRITSSALTSIACGIVMPSAMAALRLITSSNFVGCSMGRSPGFAPLSILSTYSATRRDRSTRCAPYERRPPASTNSRSPYIAGNRWRAAKSTI